MIAALGISDADAHAALRISIGRFNTREEIAQAGDLLLSVVGGE